VRLCVCVCVCVCACILMPACVCVCARACIPMPLSVCVCIERGAVPRAHAPSCAGRPACPCPSWSAPQAHPHAAAPDTATLFLQTRPWARPCQAKGTPTEFGRFVGSVGCVSLLTLARTHALTLARTRTQTHTRTHPHTHTYTHTHTHTHTLSISLSLSLSVCLSLSLFVSRHGRGAAHCGADATLSC
jgi:hypothetical protein